jgi:hypothetical protein
MLIPRRIDKQACAVASLSMLLAGGLGCSSKASTGDEAKAGSGGGDTTGTGGTGATGTGGTSTDSGGTGGTSSTQSTSKSSGGSSSTASGTGGSSSDDTSEGGEGGSDSGATAACPTSALTILFAPMYSAYDGVHTFQIPAVVSGIDPTAITIDWSASDPSMVELEPDPTTGGVMITMRNSGKVSIIATAGDLCGTSLLTISAATEQDWEDGSARYNDGVVINRLPVTPPAGGFGGNGNRGAGASGSGNSAAGSMNGTAGSGTNATDAACTNCHGDTASGPFKTVQHTPEQAGGFSDTDLINIFEHGVVPTGGYFDDSIVSYAEWQSFHKWDVGDNPQAVVVYLRSLTPAAQTGSANFGGRFMNGGAGGRQGGGGGGRRGGGGGIGAGGAAAGTTQTGGTTGGVDTGGGGAAAGTASGGTPSQGGSGS